MELPPEMIQEIIKFAPFDVVCAFAKCSKDYLLFCKNQAKIRAKEWLTREVLFDYRKHYVFPNGTKHGIYRIADRNYVKYDLGVKIYEIRYTKLSSDQDQYLLTSTIGEDSKSITFYGNCEKGFKLSKYTKNKLSIDFQYVVPTEQLKPIKQNAVFDTAYEFLETLNIKDYIDTYVDYMTKIVVEIRNNSHFIIVHGKITTIHEYLPNNDVRKTKNSKGIVSPEIRKTAIDGIPDPEIREFMARFARTP